MPHNLVMRFVPTVTILTMLLGGCSSAPTTEAKNASSTNSPVATEPPKPAATYAGEWRLAITADGKKADGTLTIMPDGSFEQVLQSQGKKVSLAGMLTASELSIPGKTVIALDFVVKMVDGAEVPPSDPFKLTYEKEFDTLTDTALAVWVRPDKLATTKAAQKK